MHLALRQHRARVTVHVEREAYSGASIVAMAGDEIRIAPGGRMQVHDPVPMPPPFVATREYRAALDHLADTIAALYAHRAGGSAASWRVRMRVHNGAGTWFNAGEALAAGLADRFEHDRQTSIIPARLALSPRPVAARRLALV
jgi:ATP-dependent protease ClpP protease subunit